MTTDEPAKTGPRVPERTCVGCAKRDKASNLIRLVVGPEGQVAVDLAGHAYGRGAHVHASSSCLQKAATKGLSRSMRAQVQCDPEQLKQSLGEAAERRILGLLTAAEGAGCIVMGHEAVDRMLERETSSVALVACDASPASFGSALRRAIEQGRSIAWGSKELFGAMFGRQEVALVGICDGRIARAVAQVVRVIDSARSGAEVR